MNDLDSIPPERLRCMICSIASMVRNTRRFRGLPLWSVVGHAFGYGSTSSHEICIKAGLDPAEHIPLKTP